MPHPSVRLIAIDLDGTLLSHEGRVGPRNLAALHAATQAGITIVIATGRRHTYALNVLHPLGLPQETPLVSSNGAIVRTFASDLIERTLMQHGTASWLCGALGEFRNALVITFDKTRPDGQDQRGSLVVEELADLHNSIGRWMETNAPFIEHVNPIEGALHGDPPIQMMLCGTVERMRRAVALMLAYPEIAPVGDTRKTGQISLNRTEYPERDLSIVDILPAGCSKGAAILRLAAARNIYPAEIMAIGDNWNDMSMLEIAGLPVLMGNAPDDLKLIATERNWHISAAHTEEGVADAITMVLNGGAASLTEVADEASGELLGLTQ
jgi:hydroxymethylpyrimidine pyrophosphatase-like HAD family hydrolase